MGSLDEGSTHKSNAEIDHRRHPLKSHRFWVALFLIVGPFTLLIVAIIRQVEALKILLPVYTIPVSAIVGFYFSPRKNDSRLDAKQIFELEKIRLNNDHEIGRSRATDYGDVIIMLGGFICFIVLMIVVGIFDLLGRGLPLPELPIDIREWARGMNEPLTYLASVLSLLTGIRLGAKDRGR